MKIKYAIVNVRISSPYNETLSKPFRVKEGQSYITQGMNFGKALIADFVEQHYSNPTPKDYRFIESISEIHVKRFSF